MGKKRKKVLRIYSIHVLKPDIIIGAVNTFKNHNQHINNCASLWPRGLRPAIDNADSAQDNKREQLRCTAQHA